MIPSKLLDNKNENNSSIFSKNLYKGACVKIKNSNKTFQVIGLNIGKKICWVREWPFACNSKKTFFLKLITILSLSFEIIGIPDANSGINSPFEFNSYNVSPKELIN